MDEWMTMFGQASQRMGKQCETVRIVMMRIKKGERKRRLQGGGEPNPKILILEGFFLLFQ